MTGNVYAVVGGRDDVGATTTAVALGASLAETSHRVAVIDADFENGGVGAALDLGDPERTLRDVLRGDADLDDALVAAPHGLYVLPSGDAAPAPTDVRSHALVRAADRVRDRFDIVLIDLGATGGTPAALALERADGAILASTPEDDAIAAVADAATVARFHGADVLGTAFTRIPEGTEIDHEAAVEAIGTDVIAMVPEDDAVAESADAGASLLRYDPDSPAAMVYWELAGRLADGDLAGEPVVHARPTDESGERESPGQDSRRQGSADDSEAPVERESPAPEPGAGDRSRSGASDAASRDPERTDDAPSDDAEPVAPPAPDATDEQDSASASAREDAADGSASDREPAAPGDSATATGSEPDGEGGEASSTNEFSWDEDPIEADESGGGDDQPFDDESVLGEASDEPGPKANDETDPESDDGAEADEGDDEDDLDAAFKATMDKVRDQREEAADEDDEGGDDEETDEDSDDETGGMFGIGS